MAFQNYAYYPQLSMRKNIGFDLRTAKRSKADQAARIVEVATPIQIASVGLLHGISSVVLTMAVVVAMFLIRVRR